MVLIDFSQSLKDLDGKSITVNDEELTLRKVCVQALITPYEDEQRTQGYREKFERGELATRIHQSKEPMELKAEEVVMLKLVLGKGYGPIVVIQAGHILDPADKKKD